MFEFEPIIINGSSYPVEIERKPVRGANAKVRGGRVVITLPERMNGIRAALVSRSLYKRIAVGIAKRPERYLGMPKLEFRHGQIISMLDRTFTINLVVSENLARPSTRMRGEEITVNIPSLDYDHRDQLLSKLAKMALTRHMLEEINAEVARINAQHFGSEIRAVKIRDMEWTWGSYSFENKAITLNFRLLFAPKQMLEYVIVHELAHSKVRGHSRAFWEHVATVIPEHKQRRKWLREHAHELGLSRAENIVPQRQPV